MESIVESCKRFYAAVDPSTRLSAAVQLVQHVTGSSVETYPTTASADEFLMEKLHSHALSHNNLVVSLVAAVIETEDSCSRVFFLQAAEYLVREIGAKLDIDVRNAAFDKLEDIWQHTVRSTVPGWTHAHDVYLSKALTCIAALSTTGFRRVVDIFISALEAPLAEWKGGFRVPVAAAGLLDQVVGNHGMMDGVFWYTRQHNLRQAYSCCTAALEAVAEYLAQAGESLQDAVLASHLELAHELLTLHNSVNLMLLSSNDEDVLGVEATEGICGTFPSDWLSCAADGTRGGSLFATVSAIALKWHAGNPDLVDKVVLACIECLSSNVSMRLEEEEHQTALSKLHVQSACSVCVQIMTSDIASSDPQLLVPTAMARVLFQVVQSIERQFLLAWDWGSSVLSILSKLLWDCLESPDIPLQPLFYVVKAFAALQMSPHTYTSHSNFAPYIERTCCSAGLYCLQRLPVKLSEEGLLEAFGEPGSDVFVDNDLLSSVSVLVRSCRGNAHYILLSHLERLSSQPTQTSTSSAQLALVIRFITSLVHCDTVVDVSVSADLVCSIALYYSSSLDDLATSHSNTTISDASRDAARGSVCTLTREAQQQVMLVISKEATTELATAGSVWNAVFTLMARLYMQKQQPLRMSSTISGDEGVAPAANAMINSICAEFTAQLLLESAAEKTAATHDSAATSSTIPSPPIAACLNVSLVYFCYEFVLKMWSVAEVSQTISTDVYLDLLLSDVNLQTVQQHAVNQEAVELAVAYMLHCMQTTNAYNPIVADASLHCFKKLTNDDSLAKYIVPTQAVQIIYKKMNTLDISYHWIASPRSFCDWTAVMTRLLFIHQQLLAPAKPVDKPFTTAKLDKGMMEEEEPNDAALIVPELQLVDKSRTMKATINREQFPHKQSILTKGLPDKPVALFTALEDGIAGVFSECMDAVAAALPTYASSDPMRYAALARVLGVYRATASLTVRNSRLVVHQWMLDNHVFSYLTRLRGVAAAAFDTAALTLIIKIVWEANSEDALHLCFPPNNASVYIIHTHACRVLAAQITDILLQQEKAWPSSLIKHVLRAATRVLRHRSINRGVLTLYNDTCHIEMWSALASLIANMYSSIILQTPKVNVAAVEAMCALLRGPLHPPYTGVSSSDELFMSFDTDFAVRDVANLSAVMRFITLPTETVAKCVHFLTQCVNRRILLSSSLKLLARLLEFEYLCDVSVHRYDGIANPAATKSAMRALSVAAAHEAQLSFQRLREYVLPDTVTRLQRPLQYATDGCFGAPMIVAVLDGLMQANKIVFPEGVCNSNQDDFTAVLLFSTLKNTLLIETAFDDFSKNCAVRSKQILLTLKDRLQSFEGEELPITATARAKLTEAVIDDFTWLRRSM